MDSRQLMIVVLAALFVVGLALSLVAAWRSGDWWGFALNLGTELVGAVMTYLLFDQFIEQRERTETEKARLIGEMGSGVNSVAVAAAEKLWQRGWLGDGSLQGANLGAANLREAELWNANLRETDFAYADLQGTKLVQIDLQGANLGHANLQEADLGRANLQGANLIEAGLRCADLTGADLTKANLTGANLTGAKLVGSDLSGTDLSWAKLEMADLWRAKFDRNTTLPDGTREVPKIYVRRFTDRDHPDFWEPPE